MSEEAEVIEDEIEDEIEQDNEEDVNDEEEEQEEQVEDDGLTLSFETEEEEELPDEAPKWAKELRVRNREQAKENRELKRALKDNDAKKAAENEAVVLGEKPKLEDFQYEEDKYAEALLGWNDRKRDFDKQETAKVTEAEEQTKNWNNRLSHYEAQKLDIDDFDDAEDVVKDTLSVTQQGIIIAGSEKSAKLTQALGKNPKVLEKLAEITDPIKFAMAIGRMETQMSSRNGKKPPSPEKRLNSSGPTAAGGNKTLDNLRAEADKTGDLSKVIAYKRKQKAAQASAN